MDLDSGVTSAPGKSRKGGNRKVTQRVKWTEEMERAILDYAKDAILNGKQFEKPTAPEYYKRFLKQAAGFQVATDKIVQRMRNMKKEYTAALEWRNRTGQGILESDPIGGIVTVEAAILKKCKYFNELDEILGDKPQFNPPFVMHSCVGRKNDVDNAEATVNGNDGDDDLLDIPEEEPVSVRIEPQEGSSSPTRDMPKKDPFPVTTPISVPRKKLKPTPVKNAAAALESAMRLRADCENRRLDWEKESQDRKYSDEQATKKAETELRRSELEFQQQKWQEEFSQQKVRDERNFELEKLRIQRDADIEKLKLEKQYELEKLRLGL